MQSIRYSNSLDENADSISDLPINQSQPSHNEIKLVDSLFKKHSSTIGNITKEFKDSILLGILFLIISLPQVDDIFKKYISVTNNSIYMLLLVKTIFFIIAIWLLRNSNLLKKQ